MARSLGKSARILKSEAKAMKDEGSTSAPAGPPGADEQTPAERTIQAAPGDVTSSPGRRRTRPSADAGPDASGPPHEIEDIGGCSESARKKEKDPEGRMPLADHLRELRNRLAKAMLAIVIVTVVAAFYYNDIINFFTKPVLDSVGCPSSFAELARMPKGKQCAQITINGLLAPFTLALKVSLMAGVAFASPVWLYQLWAFVAPGLHRDEKKYAYAFVGTAFRCSSPVASSPTRCCPPPRRC